ncbi:TonB family protein [Bordetella petrii]|nr:TonB family protein [Bordetella petrii]
MILALWAAMATAAAAPAGEPARRLFDFDIPAQPLEDALFKYGETTRLPTFSPSSLTAGLRSAPVRGRYTPEEALRRLLEGTGLALEHVSREHGDVFRLKRAPPPAAPSGPPQPDLNGYPARLQASVLRALCADAATAPGGYRALLQVSVDAAGQTHEAVLLDATGDSRRDAAMLAAVRAMRTSPPPAQSVRAPYLISLVPTPPGVSSCRRIAEGMS